MATSQYNFSLRSSLAHRIYALSKFSLLCFDGFCIFRAEFLPWFVYAVARSFLQAISKDEAVAPPLRVVQIEGLVTVL